MVATKKVPTSIYMAGDIRYLINDAIQNEFVNLTVTLEEIKGPVLE